MGKNTNQSPRWPAPVAALLIGGVGILAWWFTQPRVPNPATSGLVPPPAQQRPEAEVFAAYSGSESCLECHTPQFEGWQSSHHGLAERKIIPQLDQEAFEPARTIHHGKQQSEARMTGQTLELVTQSRGNENAVFQMDRVIGVDPLKQFLVAREGGRFQVTELAVDPRPKPDEWFDIFGEEDRHPGEWGHWTGRGMNWNNMCASCHNTRVRKNYNPATDTYATAMAERSVGCEACHGPMGNHVAWRRDHRGSAAPDPTTTAPVRSQTLATCGSCHARRSDLTGDFHPGSEFEDHFSLTIPDETDVFYPDGQVRDEDYEFTSFLASRMHLAGVSCLDCHDPHTGKTLLPGNLLCMRCHEQPVAPAPKIDLTTHLHHPPDTPGGRCIDCHMPQTVYMQRHWRHDHGFTIPDPLLSKEHGIPNACNRCHTKESVDWAVAAVDTWYGSRMNRPTRERARSVALAKSGAPGAAANLIRLLREEPIPLWRAVAANLLKRWVNETEVQKSLIAGTADSNAMVRAMSARALELLPRGVFPEADGALDKLLQDPARSVRVEAAWARRADVSTDSVAGRELVEFMMLNRDQPSGLLQLGQWHLDRDETALALEQFQTSVRWDPGSAVLRHAYAVALSMVGDPARAVSELEAACRLAPGDAEFRYKLGLAYNEIGQLDAALESLKRATQLDPQYAQAWYNLGLAYSAQNRIQAALEALGKAESADPQSARIPYARATVLFGLGRIEEAAIAASRALELDPGFTAAADLLRAASAGSQR
ncbi:MAG: tetratricopeptide repeat protein [Verrucomicrobia bacterium]|nr:tetratricopeptide repeat protein [Verrucomicrobiota bacterium]